MHGEQQLRLKLKSLCEGEATLLWLEGAKHERILSLKLMDNQKLILKLADGTTRFVPFERYAVTKVGLQFWSQNHPGVLYRWDAVPKWAWAGGTPPEDPPPGPPFPTAA